MSRCFAKTDHRVALGEHRATGGEIELRSRSPRGARSIPKYMNPRGMRILACLDEIVAETRAEPAAVALAWLMTRPAVTAPIASATKPEHVASLVVATELGLTKSQIERLDTASA